MKSIPFTVLFLLLFLTLQAHHSPALWCNGRIVLEDGEVIEGTINYDLKFEVIQLKDNGVVRAFSAESVATFTMFDPVDYRQRDFVALKYRLYTGYKRKTFFEVITHGDITVLRKSKYIRRPRVTEDYRASNMYLNVVCRHSYFAIRGNEWLEIKDFKEQVLPWMTQFEKEIDRYIDSGHLKLNQIHAQMRVVNMYNLLCKGSMKGTQAELYKAN